MRQQWGYCSLALSHQRALKWRGCTYYSIIFTKCWRRLIWLAKNVHTFTSFTLNRNNLWMEYGKSPQCSLWKYICFHDISITPISQIKPYWWHYMRIRMQQRDTFIQCFPTRSHYGSATCGTLDRRQLDYLFISLLKLTKKQSSAILSICEGNPPMTNSL